VPRLLLRLAEDPPAEDLLDDLPPDGPRLDEVLVVGARPVVHGEWRGRVGRTSGRPPGPSATVDRLGGVPPGAGQLVADRPGLRGRIDRNPGLGWTLPSGNPVDVIDGVAVTLVEPAVRPVTTPLDVIDAIVAEPVLQLTVPKAIAAPF